jgi:hypothetical protein
VIRLLWLAAAAILLAASPGAQAAAGHVVADDVGEAVLVSLFVMGGFTLAWRSQPVRALRRAQARRILRLIWCAARLAADRLDPGRNRCPDPQLGRLFALVTSWSSAS